MTHSSLIYSCIIIVTGFVKIGLSAASKVFYFIRPVGCTGSWDAVLLIGKLQHKQSSPYALQHFSIFAKLIIADFEKTPCIGVAKGWGCALYPYTITVCLRDTTD